MRLLHVANDREMFKHIVVCYSKKQLFPSIGFKEKIGMFNQKGQGSSVFQLLIAAVVALAILGVLLSIIGGLPNVNQDPIKAARTALKDAVTTQGAPAYSPKVTLTEAKTIFTSRAVTPEDLGVPPERVCVGVEKSLKSSFKETTPGKILTYKGSGSLQVVIGALCDDGKNLTGSGNDLALNGWDLQGTLPTSCYGSSSDTTTWCILIIRPT